MLAGKSRIVYTILVCENYLDVHMLTLISRIYCYMSFYSFGTETAISGNTSSPYCFFSHGKVAICQLIIGPSAHFFSTNKIS
jgi:hypothetical protein